MQFALIYKIKYGLYLNIGLMLLIDISTKFWNVRNIFLFYLNDKILLPVCFPLVKLGGFKLIMSLNVSSEWRSHGEHTERSPTPEIGKIVEEK